MSIRIALWLLQLNEFDITVVAPKELQILALLDLFASLPSRECEALNENLPCEEICFVKTGECRLAFNNSSTHFEEGGGVVFI